MKRNFKWDFVLLPVALMLAFGASYAFAYKMAGIFSDISLHIGYANEFLNNRGGNVYPGFYLAYGVMTRIFHFSDAAAVGTVMGLFSVAAGLAAYVIAGCYLGWEDTRGTKSLIVLFLSFFGPLYLGGPNYYLGSGSYNTWHNPTNSGVKFLALICFFLFVYAYQMKEEDRLELMGRKFKRFHLYLLLVALTCLSLVFKPSFFQAFAPTLVVIYGVDFLRGKRSFKSCVTDALLFLPAVAVILWQMYASFGAEDAESRMIISFGEAWGIYATSIFRSIMVLALFPLFVCIFCEKNAFKNKMLLYSMTFYSVGILEALLLCETGERAAHGNFMWAKNLGIGVAYLASLITFAKYMQNRDNSNRKQTTVCVIGLLILLIQFVLGAVYWFACIYLSRQCL